MATRTGFALPDCMKLSMQTESRLFQYALLISALALAGCGTPRSFDPSEDGFAYGSSAYQSYQACLDRLTPAGQGAYCEGNSAGGQPRSSYMGGSDYGSGGSYAGGYRSAKRPEGAPSTASPAASPEDPYFQFMSQWPAEEQQAQERAWLELAARGSGL